MKCSKIVIAVYTLNFYTKECDLSFASVRLAPHSCVSVLVVQEIFKITLNQHNFSLFALLARFRILASDGNIYNLC